MSRLAGIALALALLVACGSVPREAPAAPDPAPPRDRLYVRDGEVVKVIDVAAGVTLRTFGAGVTAPDWSAHHIVEAAGANTSVRTIDPVSGKVLRPTITLPGVYGLPNAYRAAPPGLSPRGDRLVLAAPRGDGRSRFVVLDLKRNAELARVELPGDFSFDAISDDGNALYLLQHPSTGSTAYNVRLYDLGQNLLYSRPIVDRKAAEPSAADLARGLMEGLYHSSIASRNGGWYFSFYYHPKDGPFIHALNLDARYASCILDLTEVMSDRTVWAMALAPSGSPLYVVNGATGHMVVIDPSTLQITRRRELSVNRVAGESERRRGALVFSPDGARLYVLGATGILVVNVADLTLRKHYLTLEPFDALAVSPDGARLYALTYGGEVWQIEASTGRRLGALSGLASARAILRVESD